MKKLFSLLLFILGTTICHTAEIKVELCPVAEWQKPVLSKVTFDVKVRSLGKILEIQDSKDTPSFLVFTAEAAEDLGKRLLWVDAEVEFSNGAVRKFENVSFFLLNKGLEADIKKLDETLLRGLNFPGDSPKQPEASKPVEITKLRILRVTCK